MSGETEAIVPLTIVPINVSTAFSGRHGYRKEKHAIGV